MYDTKMRLYCQSPQLPLRPHPLDLPVCPDSICWSLHGKPSDSCRVNGAAVRVRDINPVKRAAVAGAAFKRFLLVIRRVRHWDGQCNGSIAHTIG